MTAKRGDGVQRVFGLSELVVAVGQGDVEVRKIIIQLNGFLGKLNSFVVLFLKKFTPRKIDINHSYKTFCINLIICFYKVEMNRIGFFK